MERKKVHSKHHIVLQFPASAKGEGKGRKGERKEKKTEKEYRAKRYNKNIFIFICFLGQKKSFFFSFVSPPHILTQAFYVFHIFIFFFMAQKHS